MANCFGENLEKLLREREMSARALAKRLGLSAKSVQEWVGDDARMPRDPMVLQKIAEALDVSVYRLLYGCEDPRGATVRLPEKMVIDSGLFELTLRKVSGK